MKIPLTEAEKSVIKDAATMIGEKPVTWAREVLVRLAERTLKSATSTNKKSPSKTGKRT